MTQQSTFYVKHNSITPNGITPKFTKVRVIIDNIENTNPKIIFHYTLYRRISSFKYTLPSVMELYGTSL